MKRNIICISLITICLCAYLTGCGISSKNVQENDNATNITEEKQEEKQKEKVAGLICICRTWDENRDIYSEIMYDPETLVMYVLVRDGNNAATASGFSVMLNADGTPRLYNPEN